MPLPKTLLRSAISASLLAALALLPACGASVHGLELNNTTDRIVRVELLQLRKTGDMTVYSTQTLSPGGMFKNKVEEEERRPGMRVRVMLADQKVEDANWILLNLPQDHDRTYDLALSGIRLTAREQTKNRKLKNPD